MPLTISVPSISSWTEQTIELSGIAYRFIYKLNERFNPSRLYLDIYLEEVLVKASLKLLENSDLTSRYLLDDFDHGSLFLVRLDSTKDQATLGNIGIDLSYELVYFTNQELEDLGL